MQLAPAQNVCLVVEWLPFPFEASRLQLLGAVLKREDWEDRTFCDCLFDAVSWDKFPAHALHKGSVGDFDYFEPWLGQKIIVTEKGKEAMISALAKRCFRFEQQTSEDGLLSDASGV